MTLNCRVFFFSSLGFASSHRLFFVFVFYCVDYPVSFDIRHALSTLLGVRAIALDETPAAAVETAANGPDVAATGRNAGGASLARGRTAQLSLDDIPGLKPSRPNGSANGDDQGPNGSRSDSKNKNTAAGAGESDVAGSRVVVTALPLASVVHELEQQLKAVGLIDG